MKLLILYLLSIIVSVSGLAFPQPFLTSPGVTLVLEDTRSLQNNTYMVHPAHPALVSRGDPTTATDEVWNNAVCKGTTLMRQMLANDHDAGQMFKEPKDSAESEFLSYSDLEKWGYGVLEWDEYYDFDLSVPIKTALNALGVSAKRPQEDGPNRAFMWNHEEERVIDGEKYPATQASFTMVHNPPDGVIIAWGSFSPKYMGPRQTPPITVFPALQKWSDIIFLQWQNLHSEKDGPAMGNINYVFQTPIENAVTQSIIARGIATTANQLGKWPGVDFGMDTDEGKAILGSPNGFGLAFFLIQHKRQLGNKVVEKVTVFQDDGRKQPRPPSCVFHIRNV